MKLLESLAAHDVPPVPDEFSEQIHRRLNRALLATHLVDLVAGGVPCVVMPFLRGVWHLLEATFTGRFEDDSVDRSREAP